MNHPTTQISIAGHELRVLPNLAHALISAGFASPAGAQPFTAGADYSAALSAGGPLITPAACSAAYEHDGAAGTPIADVVDPFAAFGPTTFEIEGTAPPQLGLSGRTVIIGSEAGAVGASYSIAIRATAHDGRTVVGTSTFAAE